MENKLLHKVISFLYDRIVGERREKAHNIHYWRERIFAAIGIALVILGFFAAIVSIAACIHSKNIFVAVFDILLYFSAIIILLNNRVSYTFKNTFMCFIFFLVGFVLLIALGKIGAGYSWLFTFPIITGILKGLRKGVYALIINGISFLIIGVFLIYLKIFPHLPIAEYDIVAWITISINFLFLNTVITIVNGIVLRGLKLSMQEQDKLAANLGIKKEQVLKANLKLRHEINNKIQIETELREAISKAEAANVAKTEFLSNMSHEIRTPLNAIIGFTEIMAKEDKSGENLVYMKGITDAGNDLLSLVNKILDLSKIETQKLIIKNKIIDIEKVFHDLKLMFDQAIKDKGLKSTFQLYNNDIDFLIFDDFRFKQILANLIENAVKFTESGEVKVAISLNKNNPDNTTTLMISIEDTGIGIDPEDFEHLFETFWQKDGKTTRKYDGTGLGLALVKKLTEMMNGEIAVDSEKGKGSKFEVLFKEVAVPSEKELKEKNITKYKINNTNTGQENVITKNDSTSPVLAKIISEKYLPQIKELEENMFLHDIVAFGEKLLEISEQFDDKRMMDLSQKLITYSSTYELDKVRLILNIVKKESSEVLKTRED